jgi:deoxyadenosine/deoxycytidine kinase
MERHPGAGRIRENAFLPDLHKDPERYAFAVELSFLAQRYHQLKRVGELSLFGPVTVSDYSIGKSLVFASVTLPTDEATLFRELHGIIHKGLPKPDLLVHLHVPVQTLHARIRSRGRLYEQGIQDGYLERPQESYLDRLRKLAGVRVLVLDVGGKDLLYGPVAYGHLWTWSLWNVRSAMSWSASDPHIRCGQLAEVAKPTMAWKVVMFAAHKDQSTRSAHGTKSPQRRRRIGRSSLGGRRMRRSRKDGQIRLDDHAYGGPGSVDRTG